MTHARPGAVAAAMVVLIACGGGNSSAGTTPPDRSVAAACTWPAGADTYDPNTHFGCSAAPTLDICQGSADGNTCTNACTATEYALSCYAGPPSPPPAIPAPAPGLACQLIPVPTPSGALFYCCPCAP